MACVVVGEAAPNPGETPRRRTHAGATPTAEEALIADCKGLVAHYKAPKDVRFEAIPKT